MAPDKLPRHSVANARPRYSPAISLCRRTARTNIAFTYTLPPALTPDAYSLVVQRQSGTKPLPITVAVDGAEQTIMFEMEFGNGRRRELNRGLLGSRRLVGQRSDGQRPCIRDKLWAAPRRWAHAANIHQRR